MSDAWCYDCGEQWHELYDYWQGGVYYRLCEVCKEAFEATAPPEWPDDEDLDDAADAADAAVAAPERREAASERNKVVFGRLRHFSARIRNRYQ